jgi:hypothetical protein
MRFRACMAWAETSSRKTVRNEDMPSQASFNIAKTIASHMRYNSNPASTPIILCCPLLHLSSPRLRPSPHNPLPTPHLPSNDPTNHPLTPRQALKLSQPNSPLAHALSHETNFSCASSRHQAPNSHATDRKVGTKNP